jgi:fido (protein-threonine AMPylation protein)
LFQDIYSWAGKKRTVEISKDGKQFFPTSHFNNAFRYIDQIINEFKKIPKVNKKLLAEKLAEILDNVNYLHPFREGNGRTQREFLRLLALEKGLTLNLNPPDEKNVYDRYMKGTDAEIKLRKAEAKKMLQLDAKVKAQRAIKDLEKKRSEKRQQLFEAQDLIDDKKENLLTKIEQRLRQEINTTELFTIKWSLI